MIKARRKACFLLFGSIPAWHKLFEIIVPVQHELGVFNGDFQVPVAEIPGPDHRGDHVLAQIQPHEPPEFLGDLLPVKIAVHHAPGVFRGGAAIPDI